MLTLLLFLTLREHLTELIMISYCLNYIFVVYQVLPINVFPPFLHNHTQTYLVNGFPFRNYVAPQLKCGIPQGTILGPLLFLPYINDLPSCLSHSEPRMYVDDTHLTYSSGNIHSIQSSLNEDLLNIILECLFMKI